MYTEAVIMTMSSKNGGHCVAGIDIRTGEWIRYVKDDEETKGALATKDVICNNGYLCKPLDVVRVKVICKLPTPTQPENALIDCGYPWEKLGTYSIQDVLRLHPPEKVKLLFNNTEAYVTEHDINSVGYSLILICATNLVINQTINIYGEPRTKASFIYEHHLYSQISVTDRAYYRVPDRSSFPQALLVASLPTAPISDGRYFKFIACIYPVS